MRRESGDSAILAQVNYTIVGGEGFIGGALAAQLRKQGHSVVTHTRGASPPRGPLGHLIYAAGVTADFRSRPFDTLRAHTTLLADILEHAEFDSLLYLSSARLYRHAEHGGEEATIAVRSQDPEDLYDLTKLTGEALCHASGRPAVRVVRLTNVVGTDFRSQNFLFELIRAACDHGHIELRSALESSKDYVLLEDVLNLLPRIALEGRELCYNLGGGGNLRHSEILAPILAASGARLKVLEGAPLHAGPEVAIDRLRSEFNHVPTPVLPRIPGLVNEYMKLTHAEN